MPLWWHLIALMLLSFMAMTSQAGARTEGAPRQHAIAMHGSPALPTGFTHFPYVRTDAPKGGRLTLGTLGTFDSLNPFIVKGVAPAGLRGLVFESLMARSADEPFSLYPLIAEAIQMPPDRSSITFHLDQRAKFSDGRPVTADDVIFSHDLLSRKGRPYLRSHYNKVGGVEKSDDFTVTFHFKVSGDREIPLIIGLMPILPKHAVSAETFDQTSLSPPIGSGPYKVAGVDPGRSVTFARDKTYWGRDLPSRIGHYNFDAIRHLFYRDATAVFEAFKVGDVSVREENNPARWIDGYDFPAMNAGRARQVTFKTGSPAGMTGLIFNTRRAKFSDPRVRRALTLAFDGPGINQSLFHGRFVRSESFFAGSYLASTGTAASPRERALLAPFPEAVEPAIMNGTWRLDPLKGQEDHRRRLKLAFDLLGDAGYQLHERRLIHAKSRRALDIEFLVTTSAQERIALSYAKSLKRLGIDVSIRKMEDSQFWSRIGKFDFDMMQWHYSASLSPGNEQINRWASKSADIERSLNYAGVRNPAVDAMIEEMLTATTRDDFAAAVRAFDRALLSGYYLIPLFHIPEEWYALWSYLRQPEKTPLLGTSFTVWWHADADTTQVRRN